MRFARECLAENLTPVFIGYALGTRPGDRSCVVRGRIPTAVHGAIAKFIPVYEECGYRFHGWEPYEARATEGKALVVVPSHGAALETSGKNIRVAYVSGWAALDNARTRSGAEELIPYSDHADFDELLSLGNSLASETHRRSSWLYRTLCAHSAHSRLFRRRSATRRRPHQH